MIGVPFARHKVKGLDSRREWWGKRQSAAYDGWSQPIGEQDQHWLAGLLT